jgi:hypothetical protein
VTAPAKDSSRPLCADSEIDLPDSAIAVAMAEA